MAVVVHLSVAQASPNGVPAHDLRDCLYLVTVGSPEGAPRAVALTELLERYGLAAVGAVVRA